MKIQEVTSYLSECFPLEYAESFDNVGVLVGDVRRALSGVLVTLDTLDEVVEEAIEKNCNLIVSFHPIIFSGLKQIIGKSYVERTILKAIKYDIVIYSVHTALDNMFEGATKTLCDKLGIKPLKTLIPKSNTLKKLITYVPRENLKFMRAQLFQADAGKLGNYSNCSFTVEGTGNFKPLDGSNPTLGEIGKEYKEDEVQINIVYHKHLEKTIIDVLKANHPYEEVAYEVFSIDNENPMYGMGLLGETTEISIEAFLNKVKFVTGVKIIRHSTLINKSIKKVALLVGSGAFAIERAIASNADVYLTADLKYHDFFKSENKIILLDIGHYESEQFIKNYLFAKISKKFINLAVILSKKNTNPINYF